MKKLLLAARECSAVLGLITMLVFSGSAQAATVWDFTGATDAPVGIIGGSPNALTFTVDGNTVTTTSWHDNGAGGAFEAATIGREWTGLGSCNSAEAGDCVDFGSSDFTHQVDNQGTQEWVLLVFDGEFSFDSLVLSAICRIKHKDNSVDLRQSGHRLPTKSLTDFFPQAIIV